MGMTMTQKILAAHAGLDNVKSRTVNPCKTGYGIGKRCYDSGCNKGV